MPKFELDSRILVLVLPVMFIVGAVVVANWVIKTLLGYSLFDAPVWVQIPVHGFFLYLIYRLVRAIFH
jgi:hypothetical protein